MFGKFEREVSLSMTNRFYALRDPPPNDLRGNQAAIAYLQHPESPDGINLSRNYIVIMDAVARQLEAGSWTSLKRVTIVFKPLFSLFHLQLYGDLNITSECK